MMNLLRQTTIFLLVLLLASTPAFAKGSCDTQPSPAIALALSRASKLQKEEKPKEALKVLNRAAKRAGKFSHHLLEFYLGIALVQQSDSKAAYPHFRKATTLCDSFGPAWQNLGRTAYELKKYPEAADALHTAFVLTEEKRSSLLYFEALARYKTKAWDKVTDITFELFRKFSNESKKRKMEWADLAVSAGTSAGRQKELIKLFETLVPELGGEFRFRRSFASLLLQEKAYDGAMVQLKALDHLNAITTKELMILGDIFRLKNLPLDAATCYRRVGEINPKEKTGQLVRKEAEARMAGFMADDAKKLLEREAPIFKTPRLWMLLGQLRFEAKEYPKAEKAFRTFLKTNPEDGHGLMMLGYTLFQQEKHRSALIWLEKAVATNTGSSAKPLRDHVKKLLDQAAEIATTPKA